MDRQNKPYKFVVRLPSRMRTLISDAASHYRRSMNSEIVARLEHSFTGLPTRDSTQAITPVMHEHFERAFKSRLNADEEQLLFAYRRLASHQRKALLELLT